MKKTPILILILFMGLILSTCKSPNEPEDKDKPTTDTTSHNFTFTVHKIGPSGSFLNDIFVVNENDIWAVGIVYDTLPNGLADTDHFYNVVHWNGIKWEKIKLKQRFVGETGHVYYLDGAEIESVWVTPNGTVWVSVGAISYLKDGKWNEVELNYDQQIGTRKIWGYGDNNLYFVGLNGGILHYNGSSYTRLPKKTELNFTDIWGDGNEILVITYCYGDLFPQEVYSLNSNAITSFPSLKVPNLNSQTGIWFVGETKFLSGSGLYQYDSIQKQWNQVLDYPSGFYPYKIRGNNLNDYWICDEFGHVAHFNGNSWKDFSFVSNKFSGKPWYDRLEVKGNTVAILAFWANRNDIVIGIRK